MRLICKFLITSIVINVTFLIHFQDEKFKIKKRKMKSSIPQVRQILFSSHHVALLFSTLLIICVYIIAKDNYKEILASNGISSRCNLYSGKWVYDDKSYGPMYRDRNCSYMDEGMACEQFGRKDLKYQFWRWQPHHCDLPRFNATTMLEILRNKRLVFVGDSLNRNQWASMVCLVESFVPLEKKSEPMQLNHPLIGFNATDYNASIEFYWSPFLVESNCDHPQFHRVNERIVRIESIEKHAKVWADADILVFNSYLWWRWLKVRILRGSFDNSDGAIYEDLEMLRTYEMAIKTWSDWLDAHVNHNKTKVFFVSSSPTHTQAEEWGKPEGQNCYNETDPITKEGYWGRDSDPEMMRLVEKAIMKLKSRGLEIHFLNITQLSEYRKEAHPSIFRKHWDNLTEEQLAKPESYADCTHWCIPGVPDVWNQLIFANLL